MYGVHTPATLRSAPHAEPLPTPVPPADPGHASHMAMSQTGGVLCVAQIPDSASQALYKGLVWQQVDQLRPGVAAGNR